MTSGKGLSARLLDLEVRAGVLASPLVGNVEHLPHAWSYRAASRYEADRASIATCKRAARSGGAGQSSRIWCMLPFLGRPGRLRRAVACQTPGCWPAILVIVTRVYPEPGVQPPVIKGEERADSYAERLVLRAASQMADIMPPELHPELVGLARDPDLLVRAQNGRAALVEVAGLIESDSAADRSPAEREYRAWLPSRLRDYETFDGQCRAQGATAYGLPVLIFRDELTPRPLSYAGLWVTR